MLSITYNDGSKKEDLQKYLYLQITFVTTTFAINRIYKISILYGRKKIDLLHYNHRKRDSSI